MSSWERRLGRLPAQELPGGLVVHEARSVLARMRGLARMDPMPADRALRLPRTRSIHTFGMRFALDLVWIGAAGAVVRIDRDVRPRRLRVCLKARDVIESRAGRGDVFAQAVGGYTRSR